MKYPNVSIALETYKKTPYYHCVIETSPSSHRERSFEDLDELVQWLSTHLEGGTSVR